MTSLKKSTVLVSTLTVFALVCLWTSDSGALSNTQKKLDLRSGPSISSDSLNFIRYDPRVGDTYWRPAPRKVGVEISATVYGHGYAKATMTSASIGSWSLSNSEYSTADAGSGPVIFGVTIQTFGEASVSHKTTSEHVHSAKGRYTWSANGTVERFAAEWREGSSSSFFNFGTTGKWHYVGVGSKGASGNGAWDVIYYNECNDCSCRNGCNMISEDPLGPEHPSTCGVDMGCSLSFPSVLCNDEGTCSVGSVWGVLGPQCAMDYCCCPSLPGSGTGSTPPIGSGSTPPTDNTPNCPDCTSDCSSPCSCTNSGTCGGTVSTPPEPDPPSGDENRSCSTERIWRNGTHKCDSAGSCSSTGGARQSSCGRYRCSCSS